MLREVGGTGIAPLRSMVPSSNDEPTSLEFRIGSRETVRDVLLESDSDDVVFVPGEREIAEGTYVHVRCVGTQITLFLEGVVLAPRAVAARRPRTPGVRIRVAPECGGRLAFLRSWAALPNAQTVRASERYVDAACARVVVGDRVFEGTLANVSDLGASVAVAAPLIAGDVVLLHVPGLTSRPWPARVAWVASGRGGLALRFEDLESVRLWQTFVSNARARAAEDRPPAMSA